MPDFSAKSPGDRSPAKDADWITAVSAAAYAYQSRGELGSSKGSRPAQSIDRSSVKVKNLTGSNLTRGHYVQLGEFELDAKDPRKMWLEGNLYDEALPNRIGIVTNAVKTNSRVDAVLLGVAVAVVDVSDIDHRFAEPADGEYILVSAESGPVEILDTVTETGEQLCAVILSPGGGSASVEGALAIIKGTVPAASGITVTGTLTETSDVGSPGKLAVTATADTFTAGALLVTPNFAGDESNPIFKNGELRAVAVLNPSYTSFIGEGVGVMVAGSLLRITEEGESVEYFVLPWPDHRGLPGYAKGTAPTGDDDADLQIIYHSGGEESFKLDSEDCAAE